MGCNWAIVIQARYDDKWVTMHPFDTKTFSGGGDIRHAIRMVAMEHNVLGKYGIEFPTDMFALKEEDICEDNYYEHSQELDELAKYYDDEGVLKPNVTLPKSKKRTHDDITKPGDDSKPTPLSPPEVLAKRESCRARMKAVEDKCIAAGQIGNYPAHHYFIMSQQEFEKFISCVPRCEDNTNNCYHTLLAPIVRWTEMMKTANPYTESAPWLMGSDEAPEFVDGTTKDIADLQAARQEGAKMASDGLNLVAKRFGLSNDIKEAVQGYLTPPTAKDMRVAIFDDERNSKAIREGDLSEPRGCAIM